MEMLTNDEMEYAITEQSNQARKSNASIDGNQHKGKDLHSAVDPEIVNSSASYGWINRFLMGQHCLQNIIR
jgi:hypothetical protein